MSDTTHTKAKHFFANRLKELMALNNLTPTQLEHRTMENFYKNLSRGIAATAIHNYMGARSIPLEPGLQAVALALNVPIANLLPPGYQVATHKGPRNAARGPRLPARITATPTNGLKDVKLHINATLPAKLGVSFAKLMAKTCADRGIEHQLTLPHQV